jgi:hypothetical protein
VPPCAQAYPLLLTAPFGTLPLVETILAILVVAGILIRLSVEPPPVAAGTQTPKY